MQEYCSRPRNMACHNYLVNHELPRGTRDLLGLGLNYCITSHTIDTTADTFERFREDARRKYHLKQKPPQEKEDSYGPSYIPQLYIKSEYEFPHAPDEIEEAMDNFEADFRSAQLRQSHRRRSKPNLTYAQNQLLRFLRRHDDYIIVEADKNLGPTILDRTTYIQQGCIEHLGNERNYKILTKQQVDTKMRGLQYTYRSWRNRYYRDQMLARVNREPWDGPVGISDAEDEFLQRAIDKYLDKLARFRMTVKAHKIKVNWMLFSPPRLKMRPIVCCAGTFMNCWSQWLDYQLQKCKPFIPPTFGTVTRLLTRSKTSTCHRMQFYSPQTPFQCITTLTLTMHVK